MRQAVLGDTGPLYAAADPDDQYHAQAQRELNRLATQQTTVILAYPTLLEAFTLILNRLGRATAHRWLKETLGGAALLNPTPDDYRAAAAKVGLYPDQSITLFDATLAVVAGRLAVPVWTYDHHFDVMAVAVWR